MLTIAEAKEKYGLSRFILMDAVKAGRLTAYRPNRRAYLFKPEDIEKFVLSTKVRA